MKSKRDHWICAVKNPLMIPFTYLGLRKSAKAQARDEGGVKFEVTAVEVSIRDNITPPAIARLSLSFGWHTSRAGVVAGPVVISEIRRCEKIWLITASTIALMLTDKIGSEYYWPLFWSLAEAVCALVVRSSQLWSILEFVPI